MKLYRLLLLLYIFYQPHGQSIFMKKNETQKDNINATAYSDELEDDMSSIRNFTKMFISLKKQETSMENNDTPPHKLINNDSHIGREHPNAKKLDIGVQSINYNNLLEETANKIKSLQKKNEGVQESILSSHTSKSHKISYGAEDNIMHNPVTSTGVYDNSDIDANPKFDAEYNTEAKLATEDSAEFDKKFNTEAKSDMDDNTGFGTEFKTEANTGTEANAEMNTEFNTEYKSDIEEYTDYDNEIKPDTESDRRAAAEFDVEAKSETDNADYDTDVDTDDKSDMELNTEMGIEANSYEDTNAEFDSEHNTEANVKLNTKDRKIANSNMDRESLDCDSYYEYGYAYPRNDINDNIYIKTDTPHDCQEICKTYPKCKGWEWGHKGRNCWLKYVLKNRISRDFYIVAGDRNACPIDRHPNCQRGQGTDFRGKFNKTKSGARCQKWTIEQNQKHYNVFEMKSFGLGDHNYCRNPRNSQKAVWCYTHNGKKKELCDLKRCVNYKFMPPKLPCSGIWNEIMNHKDCKAVADAMQLKFTHGSKGPASGCLYTTSEQSITITFFHDVLPNKKLIANMNTRYSAICSAVHVGTSIGPGKKISKRIIDKAENILNETQLMINKAKDEIKTKVKKSVVDRYNECIVGKKISTRERCTCNGMRCEIGETCFDGYCLIDCREGEKRTLTEKCTCQDTYCELDETCFKGECHQGNTYKITKGEVGMLTLDKDVLDIQMLLDILAPLLNKNKSNKKFNLFKLVMPLLKKDKTKDQSELFKLLVPLLKKANIKKTIGFFNTLLILLKNILKEDALKSKINLFKLLHLANKLINIGKTKMNLTNDVREIDKKQKNDKVTMKEQVLALIHKVHKDLSDRLDNITTTLSNNFFMAISLLASCGVIIIALLIIVIIKICQWRYRNQTHYDMGDIQMEAKNVNVKPRLSLQ